MPFPNLDGRPSSYTDDVPDKVYAYIKECEDISIPPTKAGFALYNNVCKDTLAKWASEHPQLLVSLGKLTDFQEQDLIRYSLKGEYNSTIAKLLLQNNHGYSDKSEVKQESKVETKTEHSVDERLEKVLSELKNLDE